MALMALTGSLAPLAPGPARADAVYFRARSGPEAKNHTDVRDTWDRLIKGHLDIVPIPGTHEQIIQEPLVQELAKELQRFLTKAQARVVD